MAMRDHLNEAAYSLRRSAIREFSKMAAARENCVRLTLGEPDFATPDAVCDAAAASLQAGDTHYIELVDKLQPFLYRAVCHQIAHTPPSHGIRF